MKSRKTIRLQNYDLPAGRQVISSPFVHTKEKKYSAILLKTK